MPIVTFLTNALNLTMHITVVRTFSRSLSPQAHQLQRILFADILGCGLTKFCTIGGGRERMYGAEIALMEVWVKTRRGEGREGEGREEVKRM